MNTFLVDRTVMTSGVMLDRPCALNHTQTTTRSRCSGKVQTTFSVTEYVRPGESEKSMTLLYNGCFNCAAAYLKFIERYGSVLVLD